MLFTHGQPDSKEPGLFSPSQWWALGRGYILYSKIPVLVTNFEETKLIFPTRDVVSEQQQTSCYMNFDIQTQGEMRFENKITST